MCALSRSAVHIKSLGIGQTFTRMLGYITKDQGRPHHVVKSWGVTQAEFDSIAGAPTAAAWAAAWDKVMYDAETHGRVFKMPVA